MTKNSENLAIIYDDITSALGTLGTKDCIGSTSKIDASRNNGFRVMKTEYYISIKGKTSGEGPLMFGLAFGMNAAEIEETIEADPQSSTDDYNEGKTKRPVFPLGMIGAGETDRDEHFSGTISPRWSVPEGELLTWWVYNMDGANLTTGSTINIFAKHYGVWLRD